MAGESKINSDFALFNDILDDIEAKEREESLYFEVPQKTDSSLPKEMTNEENYSFFSVSFEDEFSENAKSDSNAVQSKQVEYLEHDSDKIAENKEGNNFQNQNLDLSAQNNTQEEDETETSGTDLVQNATDILEDNVDKEEEKINGPNKTKNSLFDEDKSSSNTVLDASEENLDDKSEENQENSEKKVSFTLDFENIRSILDDLDLNKESNDQVKKTITFDIEAVADENKLVLSPAKKNESEEKAHVTGADKKICRCKCCRNNIYNHSNFPLLTDLFNDENEVPKLKRKKKKKSRSKSKNKKGPETEVSQPVDSPKAKLDANLKDSGNPMLLEWLDKKEKAEKIKRRNERRERKAQKLEEKKRKQQQQNSNEKEEADKLQQWIDRKRSELRDRHHKISTFLDTNPGKPIQHNQMSRPKTAHVKFSQTKKNELKSPVKAATESKDILARRKPKRPESSPIKRPEPEKQDSFEGFRGQYLNNESTPVGYTSVRLFVEKVINDAIVELQKSRKIKQARLGRPETAVSHTRVSSTVIWRPQTAVSKHSGSTQHHKESWRPKTAVSKYRTVSQTNSHESKHERTSSKSYEEWLQEKKKINKEKKKEKEVNAYYDYLERQEALDERNRRRQEMEESKKRVNSGLKRKQEAKKLVEQPALYARPEPQGSENVNKVKRTEDKEKSDNIFPSIPTKAGTNNNNLLEDGYIFSPKCTKKSSKESLPFEDYEKIPTLQF